MIDQHRPCPVCHGSGKKTDSDFEDCKQCNGEGYILPGHGDELIDEPNPR